MNWLLLYRILAVLIGIVLLYLALFIREDEEGSLQNLVEAAWIRIDDFHHRALSWHNSFLRTMTSIERTILTNIFGTPIISINGFARALALSLGSIALVTVIAPNIYAWVGDSLSVWGSVYLFHYLLPTFAELPEFWRFLSGIALTSAAILPPTKSRYVVIPFGIVLIALSIYSVTCWKWSSGYVFFPVDPPGITLTSLFCGVFAGACWSVVVAESIRRIAVWLQSRSTPVILGVSALQLCVANVLTFWVGNASFKLGINSIAGKAVAIFAMTNGPVLVWALLFMFVSILLAIHAGLWPLLNRFTYALQRHGIIKHKKVLAISAATILGSVFPSVGKAIGDTIAPFLK
jgi:hypothetical protein